MKNKSFDANTSFYINDAAFLGRLVRLDDVVKEITGRHQYPKQVSSVIAECTVLAVMLAGSMKYEGLFTLQTQTDGPVSMVVVDVNSNGNVRAYARYDEGRITRAQELRKTGGEIEAAPFVLGGGHLAFTIDQGAGTELYQGIVDIQGRTLSEVALRYFRQSEQIETHLRLFTKDGKNGWEAAGLMLQKMPGAEEDAEAWNEAKLLMDSLTEAEIFDHDLSSDNLLNRMYHANKLIISGVKNYQFACRCSREKLLDTLRGFDKEAIEDIAENNKINVHCDFCSSSYVFDKGEVLKQ